MHVTGVREFRNRVPGLLRQNDLVFITRHGKLSSILVPLAEPEALPVDLKSGLLERLGEAISAHLKRNGISEQTVLRDFEGWRKSRRSGRRRR